jgi:hypothetical protein
MKLTSQRLKRLIKEELEGLEEAAGQMIYLLVYSGYDFSEVTHAFSSRESAQAMADQLNAEHEDDPVGYEIQEIQLMD